MKITLKFKTPDAVETALEGSMQLLVYRFLLDHGAETPEELTPEHQEELNENMQQHREQTTKLLERWIRYGEVLTVEFDTDKETCQVLSVNVGAS